MNRSVYIFLMFCAMVSTSCQHTKQPGREHTASSEVVQGSANEEMSSSGTAGEVSKGTIVSEHDVPVYSMISEVIRQKKVKEGMHVNKGQVLFTLDQTMHQSEIEKTQRELEQAKFQYDNILVGQGYDISNPESIPTKIRDIARTRSSLNLQEQTLHQQELLSTYYTIYAPASGIVTDVEAYQYDLAEKGKVLCRIMDAEHLNVKFSILENELSKFQIGTTVHFSTIAYPNIAYSASVVEVSPKVDENGMVKIKATILKDNNFENLKVGMTTIVTK